MKPLPDTRAARRDLYDALERGELTLAQASRRTRRIMGLSQRRYAALIGISPESLMDLERGTGNPTLKTLSAIGKPFGLEVVFRKRAWGATSPDAPKER